MLEGLIVVGAFIGAGVSFVGGLSSWGKDSLISGDSRLEGFLRKWPTYKLGRWLVESEKTPKS